MELDLSHWSERLAFFLKRWYDLPTQLLIDEVIKPDDIVVDIGGNIGMFTLAARAKTGNKGKIYAFEPNPLPREKFERHMKINNITNVEIKPFALHEHSGETTLYFPKINTGEGSLKPLHYSEEWTIAITVEIKVGDEELIDISPRFIKIDVEGAEIGVLVGMENIIEQAKPIIAVEYIQEHLQRFGTGFKDIQLFANKHHYRIFQLAVLRQGCQNQLSLTPASEGVSGDCDLVLIHENDSSLEKFVH
ncbi:MAG: FkbM family methyltransferase [Methylophaga sp.]|nr:FkbM family methyltransferase [Methylophaga sp.]